LFSDEEVRDAFALLVTLVMEVIDKPEFPVLVELRPAWGAASMGYPYSGSRRNKRGMLRWWGLLGECSWILLQMLYPGTGKPQLVCQVSKAAEDGSVCHRCRLHHAALLHWFPRHIREVPHGIRNDLPVPEIDLVSAGPLPVHKSILGDLNLRLAIHDPNAAVLLINRGE
jgi:hypothetical protein